MEILRSGQHGGGGVARPTEIAYGEFVRFVVYEGVVLWVGVHAVGVGGG